MHKQESINTLSNFYFLAMSSFFARGESASNTTSSNILIVLYLFSITYLMIMLNDIMGPMAQKRTVVLMILDGWGIGQPTAANPIHNTSTPTFDYIRKYYLCGSLQSAGIAVGLPWGEEGNSEAPEHTKILPVSIYLITQSVCYNLLNLLGENRPPTNFSKSHRGRSVWLKRIWSGTR